MLFCCPFLGWKTKTPELKQSGQPERIKNIILPPKLIKPKFNDIFCSAFTRFTISCKKTQCWRWKKCKIKKPLKSLITPIRSFSSRLLEKHMLALFYLLRNNQQYVGIFSGKAIFKPLYQKLLHTFLLEEYPPFSNIQYPAVVIRKKCTIFCCISAISKPLKTGLRNGHLPPSGVGDSKKVKRGYNLIG